MVFVGGRWPSQWYPNARLKLLYTAAKLSVTPEPNSVVNLNPDSQSSSSTGNSPQLRRWGKLALYFVLFLVVAWIYASQPAEVKPARKPVPAVPGSAERERAAQRTSADDREVPRASQRRGADRSAEGNGRVEAGKPKANRPAAERSDNSSGRSKAESIVRNARVTGEDGRVIYRGDIDLTPTLERIERGKRLRFAHDGSVFENRERRLPQKPAGYYHEFVHPTPGDNGPGGQRVVVGREGEVYYTPDHYHTFRRVE